MRRSVVSAAVLGFAASVLVVAGGCQSSTASHAEHVVPTIQSLMGQWNLTTIDGASVTDMLGPDMKAPNLEFAEDGRVSGFAGVNRVMSSVDLVALKRGEFALSPAATTMMAGPEQAMDVEQRFLSALHRANALRIDGNRLDLTDAGTSVLTFVRGS